MRFGYMPLLQLELQCYAAPAETMLQRDIESRRLPYTPFPGSVFLPKCNKVIIMEGSFFHQQCRAILCGECIL